MKRQKSWRSKRQNSGKSVKASAGSTGSGGNSSKMREFIHMMKHRFSKSTEALDSEPSSFDQQQLTELKIAFNLFDKDHDGSISLHEVQFAMETLGHKIDESKLLEIFKQVDLDGNGSIDFDEFVKIMELRGERKPENAELRALFHAFDKDNSGYIDKTEIRDTLTAVGMQVSQNDVILMLREAGVAVDGRIYYEDFLKIMEGQIGMQQKKVSLLEATESEVTNGTMGTSSHDNETKMTTEDAELHEFRVAFALFDKDGDGMITSVEMVEVMTSLGVDISLQDVQQMIRRVDLDDNGMIDFEEFTVLMRKHNTLTGGFTQQPSSIDQQEMLHLFHVFDKDRDGKISAHDLQSTMGELGMALTSDDIQAMMKQAEVGPEGKIYFADFCKIMCSHLMKPQGRPAAFTESQMKELHLVFDMFDKDKDGAICMDEVKQVVKAMGQTPNEARIYALFKQVDLDGNGLINFDEFVVLVEEHVKALPDETEMKAMFDAFDKDKNGYIDMQELKITFEEIELPVDDNEAMEMMKAAEIRDGKIYFEDFVKMMSGRIGQEQKKQQPVIGVQPPDSRQVNPASETTSIPSTDLKGNPAEEDENSSWLYRNKRTELQVVFATFDSDGDGKLSSKELKQALVNVGFDLNSREARQMVCQVEIDGNGKVEFGEFEQMVHKADRDSLVWQKYKHEEQEHMRHAFQIFDKNSNGYIEPEELRKSMRELGMTLNSHDVEFMMEQANCKIPHRIYYEEFVTLLCAQVLKPLPQDKILGPKEMAELRVAFALFDRDGDGAITAKELRITMTTLGFKPDDVTVKRMLEKYGADGSRAIAIDEFMSVMQQRNTEGRTKSEFTESPKAKPSEPPHWKAFKVFDRNKDGYVTTQEIITTMEELGIQLTTEDVRYMFQTMNKNTAGKIDYKEFSAMLQEHPSLQGKAAELQVRKEKSMYEELFGKAFTENELREAFNEFDADKTGQIEASHVAMVVRKLGMSFDLRELQKAMKRASGIRGNGKVDFNEFLKMMARSKSKAADSDSQSKVEETEMRQAFRVFDIDGNGLIDAQELKMTMHNLGENLSDEDVRAMIKAADRNGDGKIDYEEFIKMMYSK